MSSRGHGGGRSVRCYGMLLARLLVQMVFSTAIAEVRAVGWWRPCVGGSVAGLAPQTASGTVLRRTMEILALWWDAAHMGLQAETWQHTVQAAWLQRQPPSIACVTRLLLDDLNAKL